MFLKGHIIWSKKAFLPIFFYKGNAESVLLVATAVFSHSYIADGDIIIVLEHGVDVLGVQLHQIIPKAGAGDTARVDEVWSNI